MLLVLHSRMHAPSWTSDVIIVEGGTRKRVPDHRGASELTVPKKVRPWSSAAAYFACVSCWPTSSRGSGGGGCSFWWE